MRPERLPGGISCWKKIMVDSAVSLIDGCMYQRIMPCRLLSSGSSDSLMT